MTTEEAFEIITTFDVKDGQMFIKDINQYQEACEIIENELKILKAIKPNFRKVSYGFAFGSTFFTKNSDVGRMLQKCYKSDK